MKKINKKTTHIRKVARAHAVFFLISFGLYVTLSAILTPSFIFSDMRNKSTALADGTISLVGKVLAPPIEPIISGSSACISGILNVNINWPGDENSLTYDINRNGATLITGITNSEYLDNNISPNTSYTYTVIARGPMGPGFATSQPITIKTIVKCGVAPIAKITSFQNRPIENSANTLKTTSLKPAFSGITNTPYAKIFIILHSGPEITAVIYANSNGYWSWSCPEKLDLGNHTIYTTIVNPNDPTIISSDTLNFEVISEAKLQTSSLNAIGGVSIKKRLSTSTSASIPMSMPAQAPTALANIESAPFAIALNIANPNQTVYAGNVLTVHTEFIKNSLPLDNKDYEIIYNVITSEGQIISEISEKINPAQINSIKKNIPIPIIVKAEKYKIIVKIYDGQNLIESEDFFQVKELPIISVGAATISLTEIMQSLGWVSLLSLLFFIVLLSVEYLQSENVLIQITENHLRRKNFFTKRKGVSSR